MAVKKNITVMPVSHIAVQSILTSTYTPLHTLNALTAQSLLAYTLVVKGLKPCNCAVIVHFVKVNLNVSQLLRMEP